MGAFGLSHGTFGKGEASSSLPCSPVGNISPSSSPPLENSGRIVHQERAVSQMETHVSTHISQVINMKKLLELACNCSYKPHG